MVDMVETWRGRVSVDEFVMVGLAELDPPYAIGLRGIVSWRSSLRPRWYSSAVGCVLSVKSCLWRVLPWMLGAASA